MSASPDESLRDLAEATWTTAGSPEQPFGLYGFAAGDPGSALARAVERDVFGEVFGNGPELLAAEYGPYEDSTYFFCVLDHRRHLPVGAVRLLLPSGRRPKTLEDIERVWHLDVAEVLGRSGLDLDLGRVWDVATIAVAREYRGKAVPTLVSGALYQAICRGGFLAKVGWVIAVLDVAVLALIQAISHDAYRPFAGCEPLRYLDSPASVPVFCDVPAYLPRLAELDPATYALLIEGRGLEGSVRPPDWTALASELASLGTTTVRQPRSAPPGGASR